MGHLRIHRVSYKKLSDKFRIFPITLVLCVLLTATCFSALPALGAMDLADEPMMAQIKSAPANIMIVLDDSGSMTFEILIEGKYDGRYPSPLDTTSEKKQGFCYIFDYMDDNEAYAWNDDDDRDEGDNLRYMLDEYRIYWRSQYAGDNVMYYNPASNYDPWPDYPGTSFSDADPDSPVPDPIKTGVTPLNLDATSFTVSREADPELDVKHAHYFTKDNDGEVWLVVIDGQAAPKAIKYYRVTKFEGDGYFEEVKRVREETPPSEIVNTRTYTEERQNFANWFTYHRRRAFVAKNAIARVLQNLKGVRVGILGINGRILVPLKPLGVWDSGSYLDQRDDLMRELYAYDSDGGTPLRQGLNDVGKYFKDNSATLVHHDGDTATGDDPPYYSEENGGACQQSFTIVMTDGYYSSTSDPGVSNADGDNDTDWDGSFYGDTKSGTLADVAMYYYEDDLRTDLPDRLNDPDRIKPSALDTARHQHMVTFGVAFGVTGNLNPDDYNDDPLSSDFMKCTNGENCMAGQYPVWPSTISVRSKETIDDLYHATVNGRGDFLTAKDPRELADSLVELMNNILARLGSASAVSINGDSLYSKISDEVLMFQSSYKTNDWSGDVKAYRVDTDSGEILLATPKWSAADTLANKAWSSRNILSYDGSDGVVFEPSSLDLSTVLGSDYENIINYVRGKNDIAGFRVRNTLMGDIVHSSPVFEKSLELSSPVYNKNFIYVGANDGMLHAFELTTAGSGDSLLVTGEELFAYVPSFVHENLVYLTETAMIHKYFVDLTPTVVSGIGLLGGAAVETLLVGGLGKGGKGFYALDVTDPTAMGADEVLWEFPNDNTSSEVPDMGYTFAKPLVVQTNSATASEAWVVIAGNGYDSPNGRAVLYLLNPSTGEVTKKLATLDSDSDNGLSSPIAVDVNYDRKVDFVYAGDLKGNMWKFDLTGTSSSEWSVAYYNTSTSENAPLFTARGPGGSLQPITSKPEVTFHPERHGLMVLFGTGKFLGTSDFFDTGVQTVYGVWDYGDRALNRGAWGLYSNDDDREFLGAFDRPDISNHAGENVTLLVQTSTTYTGILSVPFRVMSSEIPNWYTEPDLDPLGPAGEPNLPDLAGTTLVTGHGGWYWDLPLSGERVTTDVLLRDGRLVVITFTPDSDRCSEGGTSFLMEISSLTGGLGGNIFDINSDGRIDSGDLVVIGKDEQGKDIKVPASGLPLAGMVQPPAILILNNQIEVKYLSSSTGAVHMVKEKAVRLGVTYWKELDN